MQLMESTPEQTLRSFLSLMPKPSQSPQFREGPRTAHEDERSLAGSDTS